MKKVNQRVIIFILFYFALWSVNLRVVKKEYAYMYKLYIKLYNCHLLHGVIYITLTSKRNAMKYNLHKSLLLSIH